MGKLYGRFVAITGVLFILLTAIFIFQFNTMDRLVLDQIDEVSRSRVEDMSNIIGLRLSLARNQILDMENFILHFGQDVQNIQAYLDSKLENTVSFSLLFFIDENHKITATENDATFLDNMIHQYRRQASNVTNNVEMTRVVASDTSHEEGVFFSKEIYDKSNNRIGIVGGWISFERVQALMPSLENTVNYTALVLDCQKNEALITSYREPGTECHLCYLDFEELFNQGSQDVAVSDLMIIDGIETYVSTKYIPDTDWRVVALINLPEMMVGRNTLSRSYFYLIGVWIAGFIIQIILINRQVANPLKKLYHGIQDIDLKENPTYRLPQMNLVELNQVGNKLNDLLETTSNYLKTIYQEKDHLARVVREREALIVNSPNAIATFDSDHRIISINQSFQDLFKYTEQDVQGKDLDEVVGYDPINRKLTQRVFDGEKVEWEDKRYTKVGEPIDVHIIGVPILEEGKVVGGYGIYIDINERKQEERDMRYLSYQDVLTGVYNRRFFEEELLRLDQPRYLPISLVMIDVNGLKLINDAFGHKTGDKMLVKMGQLIKEGCRAGEIVARFGGDEFILLLPATSAEEAEIVVERIHEKAEANADGSPYFLSFAYGIATKEQTDIDIQDVLKQADDRMYKHKIQSHIRVRRRLLAHLLDFLYTKSPREKTHAENVKNLCRLIGEALGYNEEKQTKLETLARIHDIGKVGVDKEVLIKTEPLNEKEWEQIKRHPETGYRIIGEMDPMIELAQSVLSHHEWFNGTGYPEGLKGKQIPEFARILAVANAYDRMTSREAYNRQMSSEEALAELDQYAGTQFDPQIVQLLIRALS